PVENYLPLIALIVVAAARLIPSFNIISRSLSSIKFLSPSIKLISKEIGIFKNMRTFNSSSLDKNIKQNLFTDSIELKNINFSYLNSKDKILSNFNLKINKGDFLGISGHSGSGKSTLIDLMVGLLEPTSGEIFIDNINLKKYKKNWTRKIGYVPQETYLMDDTIRNNIAFSEDSYKFDEERFKKTIKLARLDNFINSFHEKENKVVGERGIQLSGGEKQRIGIARALYLNPEIIVLDEPTSALDKINEEKIIEDLFKLNLATKITILLISHKDSVFRHCNKIISLEDEMLNK
ncbi:ABC transporter ATP-binding protein, partial [Candidatus Pelagibacter sp.]|nr:ABC transporter ATP-binding protein [Candidatus Pelagibacter sp.]